MVNSLQSTRWFVDTVDADVIAANYLNVKSIRWVGGATSAPADALVLRDPTLNTTLWESTASGADYVEEVLYNPPIHWINGFECPTIDVGNCYIQLA